MPGWIRGHTVPGRVAHRVEALLEASSDDFASPARERIARLERPSYLGRLGRVGAQLTARFGWRLDPGRRGAAAIGSAALVAIVIAGAWVVLNRPHALALASASPSSAGSTATGSAEVSSAGPSTSAGTSTTRSSGSPVAVLVVDVVGKVAQPGVYRLPAGSRVEDAVRAAGGVLPGVDASTLNLAQLVTDGQQIAVAVPGAPVAADASGPAGAPGAPVNLNSATSSQLDALPGVGPVLAQHIIAWRNAHGRFTSVDQLREVSGIGEAKFDDLKALVVV
jgi:competence protein ComEA